MFIPMPLRSPGVVPRGVTCLVFADHLLLKTPNTIAAWAHMRIHGEKLHRHYVTHVRRIEASPPRDTATCRASNFTQTGGFPC